MRCCLDDHGTAALVFFMKQTLLPAFPRFFGPYRVVEPIGEGAMGVVFKVQDPQGHFYAVKTLKPNAADSLRKRFLREISICEDLLHPNIAIPHDAATRPEPYLVFEYLSGRPLSRIIDEGVLLDPNAIAHIIEQLGDGLRYVHDLGIAHGDLNPGNIMVTRDHQGRMLSKILDFGVAKSNATTVRIGERFRVRGCNRPPTLKGLFGTPGYIAPELFKSPRVSARSDLFALGIIIYELVLGQNPFPGQGPVRTMSPAEIRPIHPKLDMIFERVLHHDPNQRFSCATAFVDAFLNIYHQPHLQEILARYHRYQREQAHVRYWNTEDLLNWEEQACPGFCLVTQTAHLAAARGEQETHTLEVNPTRRS